MAVLLEPLRELGRALGVAFGFGEPTLDDTAAPPRRGPLFVLVQSVAAAAVAALLYVAKGYIGGDAGTPLALAVVGFVMAVPLALTWLAEPPRRGPALVAGLATGLVTAAAVVVVLGTGPWALFVALAAGLVVAGVVFGAVSTARSAPG